ncbi:Storkhead-box protein 2, partial [Scophthalmus maximus]
MRKTSSSTLRRAWLSSDLTAASQEPARSQRSRSEKDYRTHKHSKRNYYPPQYLCQ